MNFFYEKSLKSLFILLIISTPLYGYEWFVNNFTDKTLIIAFKKRAGITDKYYQIVQPGKSVLQAWKDLNCLESLQWAELNPSLPLRGGLDLVDKMHGNQIPPDKQKVFDETFFSKTSGKGLYLWNNLKIVMVPNDLYQATKDAAVQLVKGFDSFVCQTIDLLTLGIKDKTFASLQAQLKDAKTKLQAAIDLDEKNRLNQLINDLDIQIANYAKGKISQSTSKEECFFNLAKIAEAAGNLHKISICKNREFMIFDTGTKDELTGMPLFIAETVEGE